MLQMDRPAPDCASLHPGYGRHCEPTGRANARPMTGSAKQSSFVAATKKAGLLRRVAPRNDGERANVTAPICPTGKSAANRSSITEHYGDSALNPTRKKFSALNSFFMHANAPCVARMQRSEIRDNAANPSTGPA